MYLSEEQLRPLLTYNALIPAIRQALIDYSAGKVDQPLRQVIRVKEASGAHSGWFATMPVVAGEFMAVKTVTFFPGNTAIPGQPTHQAIIELLDRATGRPLAVMDGRLITEMRTAAVSAVAVESLAPVAETLGILGSGVQARSHIAALRLVQPAFRAPGAVRVWSRDPANAAALAAEAGATSVPIAAAAACDIVVTATSSSHPVLFGKWLKPHALVLAVGAVGPQLRELDDEAMQACLIVEARQSAQAESGDILLSGAEIYAEIGQILAGSLPPPVSGRRVFKSVGMAIADLTGAAIVWKALPGRP